ncbi:MAG: VWA domain-containing protein [Blastocatellia bacterium]
MKVYFAVIIFLLFVSVSVFAQSGRRIAVSPTPADKIEEPPAFSESTEQKKRPVRVMPSLRGLPSDAAKKVESSGQTPQPATDDGEEVVTVETNLVSIPVSVFDRNGLYIPNLKKENFKIFEDGKEQEIVYFGVADKPFTVILLLDTSISTAYKIEEIQRAAIAFIDQLQPQDRVAVIEFDGNVNVLTEVTNDRQRIYKAINKADFGFGTSLYDAVAFSLERQLSRIEGRKAIVLFTDGVDTTSSKATYDKTVAEAEEADALIFSVYYNTFAENRGGSFPYPGGGNVRVLPTTRNQYIIGRKYLDELTTYTGGRVFTPGGTPGGLTAAFEGIAEELRRQYNIGYVPNEDGVKGQRKIIKVRVDRPNLVIRARDSYIVGSTPAKSTTGNPK